VIQEAIDVFRAASQRLGTLQSAGQSLDRSEIGRALWTSATRKPAPWTYKHTHWRKQSDMSSKLEVGSIARNGDAEWSWDVVDRSQHGHERRRRLTWRMSEREAAAWAAETGALLERVDEWGWSAEER
jgi:hypothetical protein